ncbi:hypothetical protein J3F83DRAFT_508890 [Trichoderma novae-zelandiae]
MPPSSSKPAPLPLAPNRASIANEISLLLSRRTALLKTLNPTPPSSTQATSTSASNSTTSSTRRYHADADAIEQLFAGPRPNQGVGYVPEKNESATSREDRMLRGRLLGRKHGAGKGGSVVRGGRGAESESDEEEGRSGLGKRKRRRREVVVEGDGEGERGGNGNGIGDGDGNGIVIGDGDVAGEEHKEEEGKDDDGKQMERDQDEGGDAALVNETPTIQDNAAEEAKRNKKKKKRQREKEKQRQKREQK